MNRRSFGKLLGLSCALPLGLVASKPVTISKPTKLQPYQKQMLTYLDNFPKNGRVVIVGTPTSKSHLYDQFNKLPSLATDNPRLNRVEFTQKYFNIEGRK